MFARYGNRLDPGQEQTGRNWPRLSSWPMDAEIASPKLTAVRGAGGVPTASQSPRLAWRAEIPPRRLRQNFPDQREPRGGGGSNKAGAAPGRTGNPLKTTASSRRASPLAARRNKVSALVSLRVRHLGAAQRHLHLQSRQRDRGPIVDCHCARGGGSGRRVRPAPHEVRIRRQRSDHRQERRRYAGAGRFLLDGVVDSSPLLFRPGNL